jgi:predicted MFS family arabinose efflux permease
VALATALVPLPFVGGFAVLGTVLFVAGFAIAPTLIAVVAWVEESVPAQRLTEGISIVTTGMGVGIAPGAAVVGTVIDRQGASASYWVPVVAAWLAAGVALATLLLPEGGSAVSRTSSR